MPFAAWIREKLWRTDDWLGELASLRKTVLAEPSTRASAERVLDLAQATELCDPDQGNALGLFVEAWRRGAAAAVPRVQALASALHAHVTLAELALADGELLTAGMAFLEAGLHQLAVDPLQRCLEAGSSELPKEDLQILLALAKKSSVDARGAIKASLDRARGATGRKAALQYLHAALIARTAELPDQLQTIVAAAARACAEDDDVARMVERALLEKGDPDALLAHYRGRFERAPTPAAYVERVRAAGASLVARELQPGLGLRFVRMSLKHSYEANGPEIGAHIAAWEMIVAHARAQSSTIELAPLLVEAMASPLSDDAAVYLARLGLQIAWRDAHDNLAAQPYAATLLDFVPDHPLATAFEKEVSASMPTAVKITFAANPNAPPSPAATPTIELEAPTPPEPQAVPPTPSGKPAAARFVLGDEGPAKRAEPVVATPKAKVISGRLALLTPPPPRTTTLRRDTSPIPTPPPRAAKPTLRAPRKVVPIDVMVEVEGGSWFSTVLRDVSASGAFILTKRPVEIGAFVSLEMQIPTPGKLALETHRANAKVARRAEQGWGIAFVDAPAELVDVLRALTE